MIRRLDSKTHSRLEQREHNSSSGSRPTPVPQPFFPAVYGFGCSWREGGAGGQEAPLLPRTILRKQLCFSNLTGAIKFQATGVGEGALRSFWVPSPLAGLFAVRPGSCCFCCSCPCHGWCQRQPGGLILLRLLPSSDSFHKCSRAVNWLLSPRVP